MKELSTAEFKDAVCTRTADTYARLLKAVSDAQDAHGQQGEVNGVDLVSTYCATTLLLEGVVRLMREGAMPMPPPHFTKEVHALALTALTSREEAS